MFWDNPQFTERYFNFYKNWFKFEKVLKILPVNFSKPWWQIIWDQKLTFGLSIFSETIQQIYSSLTPAILGYAIINTDYKILFYFVIGNIVLEIFNRWVQKQYTSFMLQCTKSLSFQAYKFFLTVDPILHSTKSTGKIISKIEGASSDMQDFLWTFVGNIVPAVVGYATVVVVLWNSNVKLGGVALVSFLMISVVNISFSFISSKTFKPRVSKITDDANGTLTENLFQNALIRSSFATVEQIEKTQRKIKKVMVYRAIAMNGYGVNTGITRFLYYFSILIISLISFDLIRSGSLSSSSVITLVITYIYGTSGILRIGKVVESMTETYSRVTGLFEFIRDFGKQTFPVLEEVSK